MKGIILIAKEKNSFKTIYEEFKKWLCKNKKSLEMRMRRRYKNAR